MVSVAFLNFPEHVCCLVYTLGIGLHCTLQIFRLPVVSFLFLILTTFCSGTAGYE